MATLIEIQAKTKVYADAREKLAQHVTALHDEIETIKRRYMQRIRNAVGTSREAESDLSAAIDASRELFVKPRSIVAHGIKIGLQKGKGRIEWQGPARVVELIEKHFPELADALIQVKKKPIASALLERPAAELKRMGCALVEAGDQVLIKDTASDIDKLVAVLLDEQREDEEIGA